MPTSGNIIDLREWLSRQLPHVRLGLPLRKRLPTFPTGIPALDGLLGGGLARGVLTELVAGRTGSGSAEVIHQLLWQTAQSRQFLALVDGIGSFDVGAAEPDVLSRLLWIRCRDAIEALKVTDLLLRDRNFPVLVLDLKLNPVSELRRINGSTWFRYARLAEQHQVILLSVTSQSLVSRAAYRIEIESGLGMEVLSQSRSEVLSGLRFRLLKGLVESEQEPIAEAG